MNDVAQCHAEKQLILLAIKLITSWNNQPTKSHIHALNKKILIIKKLKTLAFLFIYNLIFFEKMQCNYI